MGRRIQPESVAVGVGLGTVGDAREDAHPETFGTFSFGIEGERVHVAVHPRAVERVAEGFAECASMVEAWGDADGDGEGFSIEFADASDGEDD